MESKAGNGIFRDEEEFQRIYDECLAREPQAPEVGSSYDAIMEMFDRHLDEVEKHMFRFGYQCGYEAALEGGSSDAE